jgi:predicted NUDIX family phosphoesterase
MRRIGGDAGLIGMCSIGTGGHIDEGEYLYNAMYRELDEEIGLKEDNIFSNEFIGFIYSTATEVDSVHLGMVFFCWINDPAKIKCLEKDKLIGDWVTIPDLNKLNEEGKLESWTKIVLEQVLKEN